MKQMSGSAIKYCALVMMVIDHIHQMFATQGAPQWFYWIGRPCLPVFLFMCAEAFWHTRSRALYMMRLYTGFVVMNIGTRALSTYLPVPNIELTNNVFETLLLATFYMLCIEIIRSGKTAQAVGLMLLPAAIALSYLHPSFPPAADRIFFLIPNPATTEGSFVAVIAGLLFYQFREKRLIRVLIIAAASILSIAFSLSYGDRSLGGDPQWLMVFAVIPILLYNGKRGKGNKYFFYIFYPAHIFLLYVAAWFLLTTIH